MALRSGAVATHAGAPERAGAHASASMTRHDAAARRAGTAPLRRLLASALALRSALGAALPYVPGTVHTIFSTECNRYFDWCAGGTGGAHSRRGAALQR